MTSKTPVSSTTLLSVAVSPTTSNTTTRIDINSQWSLSQLPRVYRAAKKMQRVTSAWSDEKEVQVRIVVPEKDNQEVEKSKEVEELKITLKVSMRTIFIPFYQRVEAEVEDLSTLSSAAIVEFKIVPITEKNDEKWTFEIRRAPKLAFMPVGIENDAETQKNDEETQFLSMNELNAIDNQDSTCCSTAILPTTILCKNLVQDKDLNAASFSVIVSGLEVSAAAVAPKESVTDNLVQGVFSIWETVKKTVNENANTAAASIITSINSNTSTATKSTEEDRRQEEHHTSKVEQPKKKKTQTLPSSLSEALPSAERALHRWLQWICDQNISNDDSSVDDEYFTSFLPQCKKVAREQVIIFLDLLSSSNRTKKIDPHAEFMFQTMLLSPFAAAVTTVIKDESKDLRDWLFESPKESIFRNTTSLNEDSDLLLLHELSKSPAPIFSVNKKDSSSSSVTSSTTTTTTMTSTPTLTTEASSSSAADQNRFGTLLQSRAKFLFEFISTCANVLVVQIEHGAHYRPLLRAEGWGKLIHFAVTTSCVNTGALISSEIALDSWSGFLLQGISLANENEKHKQKLKSRLDQILSSGYLKMLKQEYSQNSTTTKNFADEDNQEEEEEDSFRIVTDEFTVAKEKALREHHGMYSGANSLLFPFNQTFRQNTLKYLAAKCSVDRKELTLALQEFNSNKSLTISSLEQLLDFLSETANSLVSLSDNDNTNSNNVSSSSIKRISNLVAILQNLDEVLMTAELVESKLWGSRVLPLMNVSSLSLRRKVNNLMLVAQEF